MSAPAPKDTQFVLTVFSELNEHIRATDEKNVLIGGSFIAFVSVVVAIFLQAGDETTWRHFLFSVFISALGFCVLMLQLWYREWKAHYLKVCRAISSEFPTPDRFLPAWLRSRQPRSGFSADRFLIVLTLLVDAGILAYMSYLLWTLLPDSLARTIGVIVVPALYASIVAFTYHRLVSRRRPHIA